jgi:hypothetical protein
MVLRKTKRKQIRPSAHGMRRSRGRDGGTEVGPEEAAHIISLTAESLARLARRHDFDLVSYLLSMTKLEAEEQAKRLRRRKLS